MQTGRILISLDLIESTIRSYHLTNLETSEKIIHDEIMAIHHFTDDNTVIELAYSFYHNWKVYSGQKSSDGFISKRYQELEYMFSDCASLRNYVSRFVEIKNDV